jgi:hypothetical protein
VRRVVGSPAPGQWRDESAAVTHLQFPAIRLSGRT